MPSVVYLLFFLSGAAALIYEMAWSRQLGIFFGHTVHAAAVVLGAYFAGMALGYWIAGARVKRMNKPLAAYGVAELVVGGWALATPLILSLFSHPGVAQLLNSESSGLQLAIRALATFLVLLPATIAMGATLPFIAQHVAATGGKEGDRRIALAYACNTAGAMTGVVLATFVLILFIGVRGSGYLAAGISLACGLAAILLARRTSGLAVSQAREPALNREKPPAVIAPGKAGISISWYWLAALSGAGALGLQVLYTRLFALTFHNSTYTFGAIVAVFLAALALGAAFVANYASKYTPRPWAAAACVFGAVLILASVWLFQQLTHLGYFTATGGFTGYLLGVLALVTAVVLAPVLVLGTVLPYCWTAQRSTAGASGETVGKLTALNTIAATIGALGTSFLLLPALGLWSCFALFALLYLGTGLVLMVRQSAPAALKLAALVLIVPFAAGIFITQIPLAKTPGGSRLLSEWETPYGLITVLSKDSGRELWMRQNNHYTLGATVGGDSELRQGHIPLLLHPQPRDVCFLGLATGITASSALMHAEVEQVVAVELIPEVIEAAQLFDKYNHGILDDERAKIVANDARHYLYAGGMQFDVIVSDLFVPWHSQTGYLYTVEHYRAAKQRLKDGGLFCQWIPLYQVSETELELIADSFASVFRYTTLWRGELDTGTPLLALIGSGEPPEIDGARLQARYAELPYSARWQDSVLRQGLDLLKLYVGDWKTRRPDYLNTDEHPRVEFLAPISQRRKLRLTDERLLDYYESTWNLLRYTHVIYKPRLGESMPNLGDGRMLQCGQQPVSPNIW